MKLIIFVEDQVIVIGYLFERFHHAFQLMFHIINNKCLRLKRPSLKHPSYDTSAERHNETVQKDIQSH